VTISEILAQVHELGIELFIEADGLRYRAPSCAMTPELLEELKRHKEGILATLHGSNDRVSFAETRPNIEMPSSHGQEMGWPLQHLDRLPVRGDSLSDADPSTNPTASILKKRNASNTSDDQPEGTCLHDLFAQQSFRTPDRIAVSCGVAQLTYSQLEMRSNMLAAHLASKGLLPDRAVGILLERSIQTIIAILAVLKCGSYYVSLDPAYPRDRLDLILCDADIGMLISHTHLLAPLQLDSSGCVVVDMENDPNIFVEEKSRGVERMVSENSLAYVIYTSGSTGKPKGVGVEHANVTRLFTTTNRLWRFSEDDTWSLFHSFSFDVSVWEIWGALLHGGHLVVVPYLVTRSPTEFAALLIQKKVTILSQTPTAFEQLLRLPNLHELASLFSMRLVILAGERLSFKTLKPWFEVAHANHTQIVNMYGITETTVHSTHFTVDAAMTTQESRSLIGKPLEDLTIHVLDSERNHVPLGQIGEMYIQGPAVARGYINRPELTDERFLSGAFDDHLAGRMYKSGDYARWISEDCLEYLGRIDEQVKIRGFRIELGEVQNALEKQAIVSKAVLAVEGTDDCARLLAFVMLVGHDEQFDRVLRRSMRLLLPEYMVPSRFISVSAMPLTTNGKVDRKALLANCISGERNEIGSLGSRSPLLDAPLASGLRSVGPRQLDSAGGASTSSLVVLRECPDRPQVICVHPLGGGLSCYGNLSRRLAGNWSVLGLRSPAVAGFGASDSRLSEMLSRYVKEIKDASTGEAPYLLGWSFGGLIAHALACELRRLNMAIAGVILLDSSWIRSSQGERNKSLQTRDAQILLSLAPEIKLKAKRQLLGEDEDFWLECHKRVTSRWAHEALSACRSNPALVDVYRDNHNIMSAYTPKYFDGRMLAISCRSGKKEETALSWRRYARHVDDAYTNGDHFDLLTDPYVVDISEVVNKWMSAILTEGSLTR
jgi:amino acid adenylation domain-containing protein